LWSNALAIASTILGIALVLFGLGFLAAFVFLFIDDKKKVQFRLAEWWAFTESRRNHSLQKEHDFLRIVAETTSKWFDRHLGSGLISRKSLTVSVCLSLASVGILYAILGLFVPALQTYILPGVLWAALFSAVGLGRFQAPRDFAAFVTVAFCIASIAAISIAEESMLLPLLKPGFARRTAELLTSNDDLTEAIKEIRESTPEELMKDGLTRVEVDHLRLLTDSDLAAELSITQEERKQFEKVLERPLAEYLVTRPEYKQTGLFGRLLLGGVFGFAILIAVVSDLLVIVTVRWFLRKEADSRSIGHLLSLTICNMVLAGFFVAIPYFLGFSGQLPYRLDICFQLVTFMNWSAIGTALSLFCFAGVLLFSRMMWANLAHYFDTRSSEKIMALRKHSLKWGLLLVGAGSELMGVHWFSGWLKMASSWLP
jgi:hypothetical protein